MELEHKVRFNMLIDDNGVICKMTEAEIVVMPQESDADKVARPEIAYCEGLRRQIREIEGC